MVARDARAQRSETNARRRTAAPSDGPAAPKKLKHDDNGGDHQQEMDQPAARVRTAMPSPHSTKRITATVHNMTPSFFVLSFEYALHTVESVPDSSLRVVI